MSEKYLTFQDVMKLLQVGKSSIYRRIADGTLPAPIQIGHLRRFRKSELDTALSKITVLDRSKINE